MPQLRSAEYMACHMIGKRMKIVGVRVEVPALSKMDKHRKFVPAASSTARREESR
jgi:hypothetical protein